jgi:undecaprenyl-diphosphatase
VSAIEQAAVLGVMQGLTEFLPVSSSGHLVLAQALYGLTEPEVFFDLVLHLGTLTAVLAFYRVEFFGMLRELGVFFRPGLAVAFRTRPLFRLGVLIVVGSVPTAIIGLVFQDFLTSLFNSLLAVGINLLITALFLTISAFRKTVSVKSELEFPIWMALAIGLAQGLAIAPGLSRSGVTISLAIMLGMERSLAARYSFLLSVPAVLGAILLTLTDAGSSVFPRGALTLGFFTSAVVGFLALVLLSILLKKGRFHFFVPWCLAAGILALYLHSHGVGF